MRSKGDKETNFARIFLKVESLLMSHEFQLQYNNRKIKNLTINPNKSNKPQNPEI
jgi:hypothetical protein